MQSWPTSVRSLPTLHVCRSRLLHLAVRLSISSRACHQGHTAVARQVVCERLDTDASAERLSRRSRTILWGTVQQVSAFRLDTGSVQGSLHNTVTKEAWLRSSRRDLLQADIEFISSVQAAQETCARQRVDYLAPEPVNLQLIKSYCLPYLTYCIGTLQLSEIKLRMLNVCWIMHSGKCLVLRGVNLSKNCNGTVVKCLFHIFTT